MKRLSKSVVHLLPASFALLLGGVSCSGTPPTANGAITGHAYVSGPLAGGTINAHELDDQGVIRRENLGSAAIAEDGSFELEVGVGLGTILLEVQGSGARYTELATGEPVTLDPGIVLTAVLTNFQPDEQRDGIVVSPLTTLATSLAHGRLDRGDKESTFADAHDAAALHLGQHFGDVALGRTVPADPSVPAQSVTADVRFGLVLAGLSRLASNISTASEPDLTVNASNSAILTRLLANDLASQPDALFDGAGTQGPISLGVCPIPPTGAEPEEILCLFDANTARSDLGTAVIDYLNSKALATAPHLTWLEGLATNDDPELFPPGDPGQIDDDPPEVTFTAPQDGWVVDGTLNIDVSATDATGVSRLVVSILGNDLADSDPATTHVAATFDTTGVGDGSLVIRADATDVLGNAGTTTITVDVNNLGAGSLSGRCIKGALDAAEVRAYEWSSGVKGAELNLGAVITAPDGTYRIDLEGWSGPVLVECGGSSASYMEEAFSASVTLGTNDRLRTVVKDYVDGANRNNVLVTPWTSLATAYLEHRISLIPAPTDADVAAEHYTAWEALNNLLWVSDIGAVLPAGLAPTLTNTTTDTNRHALLFAGLSQLAITFADENGTVTPGAAVNAVSLWRALEADISDGCFDGRNSGSPLSVVGVPLDSRTMRVELASAISNYLAGAYNTTGITNPADATDLFDRLSLAGPTTGDPLVCEDGDLFPDAGSDFDRDPPTILWDAPTPADTAIVRGTITVRAHATDPSGATLTVDAPAGAAMLDTDTAADAINLAWDTTGAADGNLTFTLTAVDAIGNDVSVGRTFTVDNTPPTVVVTGVSAGGVYSSSSVTITVEITDPHLATTTVSVDGSTLTSAPIIGGVEYMDTVTGDGAHSVQITAQDSAGNSYVDTINFTLDTNVPTITWSPTTPAMDVVLGGAFTATATASDPQGLSSFVIVDPSGATDGAAALDTIVYSETPATNLEEDRTLRVRATDTLGNDAEDARTWRIDTWDPRVSITGATSGAYYNTSKTLAWSVTDANLSAVSVNLDGTSLGSSASGSTTISTEGSHTLTVSATDEAGHSTVQSTTITIDTTAPTIAWTSPPTPASGAVRNSNFDIDATATDANLAGNPNGLRVASVTSGGMPVLVTLTDEDTDPARLFTTFPASTIAEGSYVVSLRADDLAGNSTTTTPGRTFVVDRTNPTFSISTSPSLTSGDWTNASSVSVTVTLTEAHRNTAMESVSASGCTASPPSGATWTFTCTTEGLHTVSASATDLAGNMGNSSFGFVIDRSPPSITLGTVPTYVNAASPASFDIVATIQDPAVTGATADASLTWTPATTPATCSVTTSDDPLAITRGEQHTITVTVAAGCTDATFTITFAGEDLAGNDATSVMATVIIDKTAPALSMITPAGGTWFTASSAPVGGNVADATSGTASVTVTRTFGASTSSSSTDLMGATGTAAWSTSITLLASATCSTAPWSGTNSITVQAQDRAGNVSTASSFVLNYDNCAPSVTVPTGVAGTMYDERQYQASYVAVTYQPCLYSDSATPTISLSYDVNAVIPPAAINIYKYGINVWGGAIPYPFGYCFGSSWASPPQAAWSLDLTGNNLIFRLNVTDVGSGVSGPGAAVQYQITTPAGAVSSWLDATPSSGSGYTHYILLDGGNAPTLATDDGAGGTTPWRIQLKITDVAGNVTTPPQPIRVAHHVIGGPVYVVPDYAGSPSIPVTGCRPPMTTYVVPSSYGLGTSPTSTINPLYTAIGNTIVVKRYRVYNGTPSTTYVRAIPTVSSTWTRTLYDHNPANGTSMPEGPTCTSNAYSPATTAGTCLTSMPSNQTLSTPLASDGSFVKALRACTDSGTALACSGGTCGTNEWQVPAYSAGAAGYIDVYLLTSAFTFLWDGDGTPADFTVSTTTGGPWNLFGRQIYEWGTNQYNSTTMEWFIAKRKRVKYLQTVSVHADDPSVSSGDRTAFELQLNTLSTRLEVQSAVPRKTVDFSFESTENSGP